VASPTMPTVTYSAAGVTRVVTPWQSHSAAWAAVKAAAIGRPPERTTEQQTATPCGS
jgi:2-methylisocitrate lyase-like PEP mutase family enzyme